MGGIEEEFDVSPLTVPRRWSRRPRHLFRRNLADKVEEQRMEGIAVRGLIARLVVRHEPVVHWSPFDVPGSPRCRICHQHWPCQTAIELIRLWEVANRRDDPGEDGAIAMIPTITATMPTIHAEPATGATQ